jgi:hypothetical protein
MNRYWISWYSGYYSEEGCTKPPFQVWITGSIGRPRYGLNEEQYATYQMLQALNEDGAEEFLSKFGTDTATICALVDANSVDEIWEVVGKHFPDYKERFCELCEAGYVPGARFRDSENRTSLYD